MSNVETTRKGAPFSAARANERYLSIRDVAWMRCSSCATWAPAQRYSIAKRVSACEAIKQEQNIAYRRFARKNRLGRVGDNTQLRIPVDYIRSHETRYLPHNNQYAPEECIAPDLHEENTDTRQRYKSSAGAGARRMPGDRPSCLSNGINKELAASTTTSTYTVLY